ncbi:hypothetical protein EPUS_08045 [Endocarpon pusillum Z07020]|uniref:TRP C-terminal domain-containing protein n=1 Tax=Endocarpon pusillum (strain Z07020 / HMAS-L-300199) TaxID=1263415 RepID=U1HW73_ENDPU|nr:uncharacterized protein EPUS_08045 [Endocarpon pusillum Z07020]ERF75000.1 hypothetical protein EPUS_08045 [Endocarpon pusillum Z07020]
MHHLIVILVWVASGGCWPLFEAEHKLNLSIARDSQPVGSPTHNSSAITIQTATLSKEINTTLTGLAFLLTVTTYWLLMRYTTTLSNEIVLPSKFLEDNIAAVLSLTWPNHYLRTSKDPPDTYSFPWVLFRMRMEELFNKPLGSDDVKDFNTSIQSGSFMVIVKIFSPVMKSLVQIAIWNTVSFWLVLVMIVNTLVYNGFVSDNITNDSKVRLILVGIYAIVNIGHQFRITILLYRNFTFVLFQTCWTIICKEFIFQKTELYKRHIDDVMFFMKLDKRDYPFRRDPFGSSIDSRSLDLQLFGTMKRSNTHRPLYYSEEISFPEPDCDFSPLSIDNIEREYYLKTEDKIESKFDESVKPLRETEIKAYEKATDTALEKVIGNVAVLLGICLATALAPWTSTQKIDATSVQLGSYALLLSISTGFLTLVGSISLLTNATYSAKLLLLFQEKTMATDKYIHKSEDVSKGFSLQDEPGFGFTKGIAGESRLTFFGLWWSTSLLGKLPCLLFGPALMLIPRFHRDRQRSRDNQKALFFTVHNVTFTCTVTEPDFGSISRSLSN